MTLKNHYTYSYLIRLAGQGEVGRVRFRKQGEITWEDVLEMENLHPGRIVEGVHYLCKELLDNEPEGEGEFVVRNLTKGTDHSFTFRSEAEDFYEELKKEKLYKLELIAKLSTYQPQELL